jgi:hypothetical protein
VGGLAVGFVFGLSLGLAGTLVDKVFTGPVAGFAGGFAVALTLGLAGWRYVALLLCTRCWNSQWLPWRLAGFLDWCYKAGLIRIAGIGYQFRHRELQDYLARNPLPSA